MSNHQLPRDLGADVDVSDIYGGSHLKAADIPMGKRFNLVVEKVTLETMPERDNKPGRRKLVLAFLNAQKTLVLNSTNASVMKDALGSKPAAWEGAAIVLERTTVPFGGQMVPALRIVSAKSASMKQSLNAPATVDDAFTASDADIDFLN